MQDVFRSEATTIQAPLALFNYELGIPPEATASQRQKWNTEAEALAHLLSSHKKNPSELERKLLGKYSGTGGIGASLDTYYTPAELAACMWQLAKKLGFTNGSILEPSAGIGVLLQFLGQRDKATAVELMPTSSQILKSLFSSKHAVFQGSFENWINEDDNRNKRFDLVIGNPPFGIRGKTKVLDYPDENKQERYFLLRSLQLLKRNGLCLMILPHGVASHKASEAIAFRKRVLANADIIAIHALPTKVFERATTNAATTDLWVLRRRDEQLAKALEVLGTDGLELLGISQPSFVDGYWHKQHPEQCHAIGSYGRPVFGDDGSLDESRSRFFKREGVLDNTLLHNILESTPLDESQDYRFTDLEQVLAHNEALLRQARSAVRIQSKTSDGSLRQDSSGAWQIFQKGYWQSFKEKDIAAAWSDGCNISQMIELHAQLLASKSIEDANALRSEIVSVLESYATKHGNPHHNKKLKHYWRRNPYLNNLLAVLQVDGSIAKKMLEDANPNHFRLDSKDPVSVFMHLRREHKPTTLTNIMRHIKSLSLSDIVPILVSSDFAIDGETVLPSSEYYVGDALLLKEKLEAKLSTLDNNILIPVFEKQLETVISKIVAPALEDIHPTPHMSWLPTDLVKSYLEVVTEQEVRTVPSKAYDLTRDARGYIHVLHNDDSEKHTRGISFIARYLTGHGARREEIDSYDMYNEGFVDWLNLEGHRNTVEQAYLEHAGVWLEPEYSSEPLDIKGWNPELVLRHWQLASARRALAQGRSIIALDVGLGKTYTAIAIALLAKQNAQCQVPVIAVPKSVIPNWRQEFYKAKATAKLLVVGAEKLCDSSGRALLDGNGKEQWVDVTDAVSLDRQLTMMRQDDWDTVLMTHTTLKRIKMHYALELELLEAEFRLQHDAADYFLTTRGMDRSCFERYGFLKVQTLLSEGSITLESLRKSKQELIRLETELKAYAATKDLSELEKASRDEKKRERAKQKFFNTAYSKLVKQGNELQTTWESLSVDLLICDEAHRFKGLWGYAQSRQPKYLGAQQDGSQMAMDLYLKIAEMRRRTNGRNVHLLTATPLKNSPVELYSMMSYVAPECFKRLGIHNLQDFVQRYCIIAEEIVLKSSGEWDSQEALVGLKNLSELRREAGKVIERKDAIDVGLDIPEEKLCYDLIKPRSEQVAVIKDVADDPAKAIENYLGKSLPYVPELLEDGSNAGEVSKAQKACDQIIEHHRLALLKVLQRAELDMELIDPIKYVGYVSPKVEAMLAKLKSLDSKVVIFCDTVDMLCPQSREKNPNGYSFHQKLAKLIAKHTDVKPDEIGIINGTATPTAESRQRLANSFCSGTLKILLGSSGSMGEGINAQIGCKTILNLDITWHPSGLIQRKGRVIRQGNDADEVENIYYLGTRGLDPLMLDIMRAKMGWYDAFWNGESDMMETPNQELLPSRDMLKLLAIDDEEERNSLIETIKTESQQQESQLAKARIAKQFFKLQKQELTLYHHQERFSFNRKNETKQLHEHIAKQKERILKMPYAESYQDFLTHPLVVFIHLNTGELIEVGQVFEGERYGKAMHYTVTAIDYMNFKVKLSYDYYGSQYDDEMTLRKLSQMNLVNLCP